MSTVWRDGELEKRMTAPVSLIVSAFAPCADIRLSLTPQLRHERGEGFLQEKTEGTEIRSKQSSALTSVASVSSCETLLLFIDLGRGRNRLGGSILAQTLSQTGDTPPDVDSADDLKNFWNAIQQLGREKKILAYHDRSDGGLLTTAVEMAFAGHVGVTLDLDEYNTEQAETTGAQTSNSATSVSSVPAVVPILVFRGTRRRHSNPLG